MSRAFSLTSTTIALALVAVLTACGNAAERTVYSNLSNKDLQTRVLRMVGEIRQLAHHYRSEDRELMAEYERKSTPDIRIDQRKIMRQQWLRESETLHDKTLRRYKDKYWAEAILLRNELYTRLPKRFRQQNIAVIYQHPTNVLGIEAIADHLELLAKSLPDK